jgi:hypothetical protein
MNLGKLHVKYVIKCELPKARLGRQMGGYGIVGQVINVPVDMNNKVTTPQSQLDDDYVYLLRPLKRNLIHKSTYLPRPFQR